MYFEAENCLKTKHSAANQGDFLSNLEAKTASNETKNDTKASEFHYPQKLKKPWFWGQKRVQKGVTMKLFSQKTRKTVLQKSHVFENSKNSFMRPFGLVKREGAATLSVPL